VTREFSRNCESGLRSFCIPAKESGRDRATPRSSRVVEVSVFFEIARERGGVSICQDRNGVGCVQSWIRHGLALELENQTTSRLVKEKPMCYTNSKKRKRELAVG